MAKLDKRRQLTADAFVKMEGLLRSEADELKQVKPPRETKLDWFGVLVVMRTDVGDLDLAASDLHAGGQPQPPLAQQPDPSTTKFLREHGLSVCFKYRQGAYG